MDDDAPKRRGWRGLADLAADAVIILGLVAMVVSFVYWVKVTF